MVIVVLNLPVELILFHIVHKSMDSLNDKSNRFAVRADCRLLYDSWYYDGNN